MARLASGRSAGPPTHSPSPSPAPASPAAAARPRAASRTRTDKKALLDALADELKHARAQAEDEARRMIEVEEQVELKHREFLDEEMRLKAKRDTHAAAILALRRDLARARQALEDAAHVDEAEAQAYLDLLHAENVPTRDPGHGSEGSRERHSADDRAQSSERVVAGYGDIAPASPTQQDDPFRAVHPLQTSSRHDRLFAPERPTSPLTLGRYGAAAGPADAGAERDKPQTLARKAGASASPNGVSRQPLSRRLSRAFHGLSLARTASRG